MISKPFQVIENTLKIGTHIHYFKEYLAAHIRSDEEFYVGVVSTFVSTSTSMTDEAGRK